MDLEEITLRSPDGAYQRTAWFYPGPRKPHHLCVLLDGEYYLERTKVWPLVERLTRDEQIPPMSWLFIASGGPEARHADFTYSVDFARFIAEDAISWAHQHAPSIVGEQNVICGLSLSGLAAAHLALLYGSRFSAALCQSGSFWWKPDTLASLVEAQPPRETRFWLSVGDEETESGVSHPPTGLFQATSQIDGVRGACSVLEPTAAAVRYHCYKGGHEFEPWRAEFADALEWLVSGGP